MSFTRPELFLLLLPAGGLLWHASRGGHVVTTALRALILVALIGALAGPHRRMAGQGRDLVVVVDRSRSMPPEAVRESRELIELAKRGLGPGDRLSVVGFGGRSAVEEAPSERPGFEQFTRDVDADASDLAGALETALALVPDGRAGSLLLVSDGESTGRNPVDIARRALSRGIPIDARRVTRPDVADLVVERFELPEEVATGEPFPFGVWVTSDRKVRSSYRLLRNGELLSEGTREFDPGRTRLVFRDRLELGGIARYELVLEGHTDRVPENDRGLGALLVRGAPRLLVLNHAGSETPLVQALRKAGLPVTVRPPEGTLLDAATLAGFRGVVLEDVAATRIGRKGLLALHDFVVDRGGGLALTGGRASFGVGGYHLSPIDPLLPVSLEMREEHRKLGVAIAIALDRSGSMAVPVGTVTKMDLANSGTAEAIRLLSPRDAVAVIAVDTKAHVVQDLVPVDAPGVLIDRVTSIESMGGGIYTYTALLAAARQLEDAEQKNRHITLFADANDSEEQDRCRPLVDALYAQGVTLSVIALGTEADSDADFLKDIARRGGGTATFTTDAADLPRLFALDTVTAARSTLVEEPTGVQLQADLFGLGLTDPGTFPTLPGYNLTYLRPEGRLAAVTTDSYKAPILAFTQRGLGRCASYTGQVGGSLGGPLVAWEGFADLFATIGRWLVGNEEPETFFPDVHREGNEAVIRVEVDLEAESPPDTSRLRAVVAGTDGSRQEVPLERIDEGRYEARFPLVKEGILVGSVALDEKRVLQLPPVALPYSPEFEDRRESGEALLGRITRTSQGALDPSLEALSRGRTTRAGWRDVRGWFLVFALVTALVEIAGRRLSLWGSLPRLRKVRQEREPSEVVQRPAPAPVPSAGEAPPKEELGSALARARKQAGRRLER